ncbi:MAG: GTP-dependent dephospho-CoA kinase family protein [Halanaeroarchaeum sp.]
MTRTVATLPESSRAAFKAPLGPIFDDPETLLEAAGTPIVAVGDVVTYHLVRVGVTPQVALIDGITEREPVDDAVSEGVPDADREVTVSNPPGTLTESLLEALGTALERDSSTLVRVDGEEDLAALPAMLMAPTGASVVYGQPGEGMVLATVTPASRAEVRDLCGSLDTDDRFWELVGVDSPE